MNELYFGRLLRLRPIFCSLLSPPMHRILILCLTFWTASSSTLLIPCGLDWRVKELWGQVVGEFRCVHNNFMVKRHDAGTKEPIMFTLDASEEECPRRLGQTIQVRIRDQILFKMARVNHHMWELENEFGRHIIMGNHIGVILRDTSVTIMARENFTLSHNFQLVEKQVFDFDIRVRFPACKTIISVPIGIFAAQGSDNYRMLIVCLILTGVAIIAISFFVCMLMCCCNNQKPPVQVSESTEDPESVVTTSERSSKSSKKCSKTST